MNLTEKIAAGILALGLTAGGIALARGVDTKTEDISCSNRFFDCKPADCRKYCRETFGSDNRIERARVVGGGQTCRCEYTPKQITINRDCENKVLACSANDCDEQCRSYVASRDGTFQYSSPRKDGCSCTYKPK
jgi:hypothetical protein